MNEKEKRILKKVKYAGILLLGNLILAFQTAAFIIPHNIIKGVCVLPRSKPTTQP